MKTLLVLVSGLSLAAFHPAHAGTSDVSSFESQVLQTHEALMSTPALKLAREGGKSHAFDDTPWPEPSAYEGKALAAARLKLKDRWPWLVGARMSYFDKSRAWVYEYYSPLREQALSVRVDLHGNAVVGEAHFGGPLGLSPFGLSELNVSFDEAGGILDKEEPAFVYTSVGISRPVTNVFPEAHVTYYFIGYDFFSKLKKAFSVSAKTGKTGFLGPLNDQLPLPPRDPTRPP